MLKRLIYKWERKLAQRDNNRVVRPFEWGLEFLRDAENGQAGKSANGKNNRHQNGHTGGQTNEQANGQTNGQMSGQTAADDRSELETIFAYNERVIADSHQFFAAPPVSDFDFDGEWVRFASVLPTPYETNNTVHARYFPVPPPGGADAVAHSTDAAAAVERARRRAVLVLPHWNAKIDEHVAVCRLLNRIGIAALRISLPFHDRRMPAELERADYIVSANLGRTLEMNRQAVLDCRSAIDWLVRQGYERIGIIGTSLGSCIAFLTFIHDERIRAGVYNHVSSYFGDVVWDGITTSHVRRGLETVVTKDEVRRAWLAISPNAYVHRLRQNRRRGLLISGRYDLSFTPQLSKLLFDECDRHGVNLDRVVLPCGHYTLGRSPYKYYVGFLFVKYLRQHL